MGLILFFPKGKSTLINKHLRIQSLPINFRRLVCLYCCSEVFSTKGTQKLIESILDNKNLGKIFIEPHLKNRMKLGDKRIRYHGCRAVRHDDHIHIQLKLQLETVFIIKKYTICS